MATISPVDAIASARAAARTAELSFQAASSAAEVDLQAKHAIDIINKLVSAMAMTATAGASAAASDVPDAYSTVAAPPQGPAHTAQSA
jgi:cob(I)alamin adenosyltransferase